MSFHAEYDEAAQALIMPEGEALSDQLHSLGSGKKTMAETKAVFGGDGTDIWYADAGDHVSGVEKKIACFAE